jgi:low temperature requirement protein LtrA
MIAGIALIAVGVKQTLEDVGGTLGPVIATALLGGAALYLLGHVGFRLRNVHTLNRQRLVAAVLLLALIPAASRAPGLAGVAGLAAVLSVLVAYEATRFAEARDRVRHQPATDE